MIRQRVYLFLASITVILASMIVEGKIGLLELVLYVATLLVAIWFTRFVSKQEVE